MSKPNIGQGNVHEEYYMGSCAAGGEEIDLDKLAEEYVSELTEKLNDPDMRPLRAGIKADIAEKKTIFKQLVGYGIHLAAKLKAQKPVGDRCNHGVDGKDCYECYPTNPSDEGLEAAARKYLNDQLDEPVHSQHVFTPLELKEAFKAGAAHQAPISRAEGFRECLNIMRSGPFMGSPRPKKPWSSEHADFVEQEGIRLGILKGDGE